MARDFFTSNFFAGDTSGAGTSSSKLDEPAPAPRVLGTGYNLPLQKQIFLPVKFFFMNSLNFYF